MKSIENELNHFLNDFCDNTIVDFKESAFIAS